MAAGNLVCIFAQRDLHAVHVRDIAHHQQKRGKGSGSQVDLFTSICCALFGNWREIFSSLPLSLVLFWDLFRDMERPARFAYLLEPIRDLTKNWEVDVASQLDDYLSEVHYAFVCVATLGVKCR